MWINYGKMPVCINVTTNHFDSQSLIQIYFMNINAGKCQFAFNVTTNHFDSQYLIQIYFINIKEISHYIYIYIYIYMASVLLYITCLSYHIEVQEWFTSPLAYYYIMGWRYHHNYVYRLLMVYVEEDTDEWGI